MIRLSLPTNLYPRRVLMSRKAHNAACCVIGCGLFPALALSYIHSPWWAICWAMAVLALVIWESIAWPRKGDRT